ncbi:hypothetical protein VE00_10857 [Pseudogymnoascus sp. WSF 3629]|nr:hypothetical protein VE00_10857 [Pseudogymnoascus sp. WSF 3629]
MSLATPTINDDKDNKDDEDDKDDKDNKDNTPPPLVLALGPPNLIVAFFNNYSYLFFYITKHN